jgi:hypothetical protein
MRDPESGTAPDGVNRGIGDQDDDPTEIETVLTTAADVESAGRSCLAIVVMTAIILALLLLWIVVRSTAGR